VRQRHVTTSDQLVALIEAVVPSWVIDKVLVQNPAPGIFEIRLHVSPLAREVWGDDAEGKFRRMLSAELHHSSAAGIAFNIEILVGGDAP
jgi:hypothetical protein